MLHLLRYATVKAQAKRDYINLKTSTGSVIIDFLVALNI